MISERARAALKVRIATSPEFSKNLQRPETTEAKVEEEKSGNDAVSEVVSYDEIDSSRTIDEEVEALILQKPNHLFRSPADVESDHDDVHIIGMHVEKYTGLEFSSHVATGGWVEWDATSHM